MSKSYLREKLYLAIETAMFASDPQAAADVFTTVRQGLDDEERTPYLDGDDRVLASEIAALIQTSPEDAKHPQAASRGTSWVRASRMTPEESRELAGAMWRLYHSIGALGSGV